MKKKKFFITNEYAKSMFILERLNSNWIKKCKNYLKSIFKNKIKNSIVVDYAFGNGNWSVAFRDLGAKQVISIDDSQYNVDKFQDYIKRNNIKNIKIIKGDILDVRLDQKIDIFWIYGIFHHIQNISKFISNIKKSWRNSNSTALIYVYNKYSLRELIINFSRKFLKFKNYNEFKKNSFIFNNFARMRVRDDMVVNYIKWYSKYELLTFLKKKRLYANKFFGSFDSFLGKKNFEFNPHLLLLSKRKLKKNIKKKENYDLDLVILSNLLQIITAKVKNKSKLKNISIGLLNCHFNGNYDDYSENLTRVALFLFYIVKSEDLQGATKFQKKYLNVINSIYLNKSFDKKKLELINKSKLLKSLYKKKIRI